MQHALTRHVLLLALSASWITPLQGQVDSTAGAVTLRANPSAVVVMRGATIKLDITAHNAAGRVVQAPIRVAASPLKTRIPAGSERIQINYTGLSYSYNFV